MITHRLPTNGNVGPEPRGEVAYRSRIDHVGPEFVLHAPASAETGKAGECRLGRDLLDDVRDEWHERAEAGRIIRVQAASGWRWHGTLTNGSKRADKLTEWAMIARHVEAI